MRRLSSRRSTSALDSRHIQEVLDQFEAEGRFDRQEQTLERDEPGGSFGVDLKHFTKMANVVTGVFNDKLQLKPFDIIIKINGYDLVEEAEWIDNQIVELQPDEAASITVLRPKGNNLDFLAKYIGEQKKTKPAKLPKEITTGAVLGTGLEKLTSTPALVDADALASSDTPDTPRTDGGFESSEEADSPELTSPVPSGVTRNLGAVVRARRSTGSKTPQSGRFFNVNVQMEGAPSPARDNLIGRDLTRSDSRESDESAQGSAENGSPNGFESSEEAEPAPGTTRNVGAVNRARKSSVRARKSTSQDSASLLEGAARSEIAPIETDESEGPPASATASSTLLGRSEDRSESLIADENVPETVQL